MQPPAVPRSAQSEGTEFTGIVSGLDRNVVDNLTVMTMRIERHDAAGNRLTPVPLEMRGSTFSGSLANGDRVRVSGRWKRGALRTDRLDNITTGAHVRGEGPGPVIKIAQGCILTVILGFILGIPIMMLLSDCSGR